MQFQQSALILQTVGLVILGYLLYQFVTLALYYRRMKNFFKHVKAPKSHWLFGTLPYIPKDNHERTMYFLDITNKYGSETGYTMMWGFFGQPLVIPCSPETMGRICKSNEPKTHGMAGTYRMLLPWLGDGLLVANGSKWARNRRLLTPAFHFEILKPYMEVYNRSADKLCAKIADKASKGERFEVFQNICLYTLEVILKCAFSYDKDVQSSEGQNPYALAVNRLTDSVFYRFIRPYFYPDFIWYMSATGRQFKKDCDYVHSVAEEIIDKRKKDLANMGDDVQVVKSKRYIDFLDILLFAKDEKGNGLTNLEVRNEVDTFLFEGHDTTASAISWILYSLADTPEWQKKCQQEIDDILADTGKDELQWSDLQKLECLTMCIKEGMRLHSPVPIVNRRTEGGFSLGDTGEFPSGTIIQINIWALNHMENVWGKDHMEFKPERFEKDSAAEMSNYQYVPFSAGPRNCVGQHFALNEEKAALAKLLRNFTFTVDKSHEIRRNISAVMRTDNGMYLFAKKREHAK